METGIADYPWMMYRVFFGYNLHHGRWECCGGGWVARPNLRIHGASDAICGPIVAS